MQGSNSPIGKTPDIIFIALSSLLVAFVLISALVTYTGVPSIDTSLLLALRDSTDSAKEWGPAWVGELMRDITALGSNWILIFFTVLISLYLKLTGKTYLARYFLGAIVSGAILSFLLKLGFARPRPELVPHATHVYTSSFPSGHAMSSSLFFMTFALTFAWQNAHQCARRLLFVAAILIPICVAFSRVYLGVHWPTDVSAGLCAGFFWSLLCYVVVRPFLLHESESTPKV